jgi:hypothetical protein
MSIRGEMPIGVLAVRPRKRGVRALTPAVNAEIEPDFTVGGPVKVARADSYGRTSLVGRVVSLERISPTFTRGHCDDDTQHR